MIKLISILSFLVFLSPAFALDRGGDGGGGGGGGRDHKSGGEDGGASVRWTLADWLSEKQQFKIEDQWLALHRTQGQFELILAGGGESYTLTSAGTSTSQTASQYEAGFFYSIFGLEYEYESSNENWVRQSGEAKIRLFGTHGRSSFLNIGGGERSWSFSNPSSSVTNAFAQAQINLYIVRFFGLEGEYDQYFKANDNVGNSYDGTKVSYGAFIEIGPLRVGARQINDTTNKTPSGGAAAKQTRNGTEIEAGFFF